MATRTDNDNWQTLGQAVRARREALGLTQRAAIAAAGVTEKTWIEVEKGTRSARQPLTLAAIDRALLWHAGTCRSVSEGADVPNVPVPSASDHLRAQALAAVEAERAAVVARLAQIDRQLSELRSE